MSDSDSDEPKGTYYHYTNKKGAKGIEKSGVILASKKSGPTDDAALGDGAYFTQLGPENSTRKLVANNYDSGLSPPDLDKLVERERKKTKYFVEVEIPKKEITMKVSDDKRNVGLHEKGDLHLKDYKHKISKRQDKK